ncbi:MAG: hypothetical protein O2960_13210 [Verrucomicrobia bacterium]|nr:hypothetical protein [Verrucomicrobiota bacterium]
MKLMNIAGKLNWLSLIVLALLFSGCSTFNRDWKAAGSLPNATDGMQGRWAGKWVSNVNGHSGALRCLVSKETEGNYKARFYAEYRRIFRFGYTVILNAKQTNRVDQFQGDADLGWYAGGQYHYEGHASEKEFFATYSSKQDHGTFEMRRSD